MGAGNIKTPHGMSLRLPPIELSTRTRGQSQNIRNKKNIKTTEELPTWEMNNQELSQRRARGRGPLLPFNPQLTSFKYKKFFQPRTI